MRHTKLVKNTLLILITALAFFLRFNQVTKIPPALNWDEVSIAYNSYSILKTGKDEWGMTLPSHFKAYGEYKLPVQVYASIPGIALFGLTELGIRITPVMYGTITVIIVYLLTNELFKNKKISLLAAFLLAISPWHIHLTRASFESSFSVLWVTLGILFAIKGLKERKWLFYSTIPFALSIYTYNSARVFTPLFLLLAFLMFKKEILKDKKIAALSASLLAILMIPLMLFLASGDARARFKLVSIVDDPGFELRINEARGALSLPEPLPRLVHNKVTHFAYVFTKNYLAHFTPDYLFISGAPHKQHHVQGVGQMYAFQFPFVVIGLIFLFKKKVNFRWLLVGWILLAFIPVSITADSIPHALRTVIAVVPYEIITAYGLFVTYQMLEKQKVMKKIAISILLIVMLFGIKSYLENYYNVYPKAYSRDWQYGYKEIVNFIKEKYDNYDLIVFTRHYGEPHMFTLFFLNWDPAKFQSDPNLNRFETYDWVRVLRFDKFYFPDLGDVGTKFADIRSANPGKKILFIGKPGDFPSSTPKLLIVDFLNGDRAFDIVEVK